MPVPRPRLEPVVYGVSGSSGASPWFAARRPAALSPVSQASAEMELWHPQPKPGDSGFPWFG